MTTVNGTPTPDALRELVREVLRDVLPALAARNSSPSTAATASPSAPFVDGPLPTAQRVSTVPPMPPAVPVAPPTSDPPPSRAAGTPGASGIPGTRGSAGATGTAGTRGSVGPDGTAGAGGASRANGAAGAFETALGVTMQPVRLATDEDLHTFVLQIVRLADNPKRRRDLLAGRFRFTLASAGIGPAPVGGSGNGRGSLIPAGLGAGDHRIERGAVTERAVQAAANAGARLVLGPRAVLTPLARDRARALGVPIEKER